MALALTRFEALVGFVSPSELAAAFQRVPELATACGPEAAAAVAAAASAAPGSDAAVAALRSAFGALMSLDSAAAAAAVSLAAARLRGGSGSPGGSAPPKDARDALLLRLHEQYPGDVGVLAASMLNYVTLAPGEGVALAANEPHAYLSGECVECMATSDNVVRAGLTPKLRDVPTLAAMLTYSQGKPRVLAGEPAGVDGDVAWVRAYAPGFDEFELDAVALPEGRTCALRPSAGAAVLLVTGGGGEAAVEGAAKESMAPGHAWLLPPGAKLKLHAHQGELRAFRARVADKALA